MKTYKVDKRETIYSGGNLDAETPREAWHIANQVPWLNEEKHTKYEVWTSTELMLRVENGEITFERKEGE